MEIKHTLAENSVEEFYEPTRNEMGFMLTQIDPFALEFIEYLETQRNTEFTAIDIGAAYGIVTLEAHRRDLKIIANDLSLDHLNELQERARGQGLKDVPILPGSFFELSIAPNSLSGIYVSRVLHFLEGPKIIKALQIFYSWLAPGGKLFSINETPYFGTTAAYLPLFFEKKARQDPWPGYIGCLHVQTDNRTYVNKPVHLLDEDACHKCLKETDFILEKISYYDRKGYFPPSSLMDGRESIGFIARKP